MVLQDDDGARAELVAIDKVSSVDYLNRVFDCYAAGRVVVPVDAGSPLPQGLAFAERLSPAPGGGWFTRSAAPIHSDAPAQISFSSGTTGTPKAILLAHRALGDVTVRLIEAMGMDSSIREYLGVPATFSFGLGRVRAVAAVGGQIYLPPNGFDPSELARMLEAGEVNAFSAVPTLLRVLIQNPGLISDSAGAKLRWLEIGSQPMSGQDKQAIRRMFPAASIVQHYGLTEASRSTFLEIHIAGDAQLESVGRPTGAVETRTDADGHICIRGPHVADGILTGAGLTPIADAEGWLRTNDLGRIDADGFVHFLGRADHLLNIGGIKVPAELFEEKLAERIGADAANVAIAGRADALRGEVVLVAHLGETPAARIAGAVRETGASFGLSASDVVLVEVAAIPRTATGKVQRGELASQAAAIPVERMGGRVATASPGAGAFHSEREREIAAIWGAALGIDGIGRDDSFFDIGGDSLSAVTVALRAEQSGMSEDIMQYMFAGLTVAQIAALVEGAPPETIEQSRTTVVGNAINVTRGLLALLVIGVHWMPFVLERIPSFPGLQLATGVVFGMGTPGFAMVFGIGLAFFYIPVFERSPQRLSARVRTNVTILGGGVAATAILLAIHLAVVVGGFDAIWPERVFYTVILSYFLLLATVPLLIRAVTATPNIILNSLMLSAASLAVLLACQWLLEPVQLTGFANLGRMMLVTAYSYPQMVISVGIGMAFGHWFRSGGAGLAGQSAQLGLILVVSGLALLLVTGGIGADLRGPKYVILYAGVLLLCFALILTLVETQRLTGPVRLLMLIGVLSFPLFISHGFVIPLKDIGEAVGLPYLLALLIPLGLFVGLTAFALVRLNRIYFGGSQNKAVAPDIG